MGLNVRESKKSRLIRDSGLWDFLIALRLYLIATFLLFPAIYILFLLKRPQPVSIIILGFSLWLILKFVFFERRNASGRFLVISLALLAPAAIVIFFNFAAGLMIDFIHGNVAGIYMTASICIGTVVFFGFVLLRKPFRGINTRLTSGIDRWSGAGQAVLLKRNALGIILVLWSAISVILLFVPYRIYELKPSETRKSSEAGRIGIWTYGASFGEDSKGTSMYVSDEMLRKLSDAGVYFIFGIRKRHIGEALAEKLLLFRKHGIEVHISVTPNEGKLAFVNIWTFERLEGEIEDVLSFMDANDLIGNPVTALVYDMEGMGAKHFPFYGGDSRVIGKLSGYYEIQGKFREFNRHVRNDYGIDVRICTDVYQAVDLKDGDDDIMALWGLMSDENAGMSYMVYRRDDFDRNQMLDHERLLKAGDTIILNAWKTRKHLCWGDLNCALEDARLSLGYPDKKFDLEIWALWYFLKSYGRDGLRDFIGEAAAGLPGSRAIEIRNEWPHSIKWDLLFDGICLLDMYSPLFRTVYRAW